MRGEHDAGALVALLDRGSSPLARGAPMETIMRYRPTPIIPACAGSTLGCWTAPCCRGDHPRLRGEHRTVAIVSARCSGSSPLARGALGESLSHIASAGIIPACAGSTQGCPVRSRQRGDHPRLRGEHTGPPPPPGTSPGSSPLARGARVAEVAEALRHGIIPACAGSTTRARSQTPPPWDHPRLRGEHQ